MTAQSARIVTLVAGLVVAGAAFLPWAVSGIFAIDGMRGDGVFALGLGLAIAVLTVVSWNGANKTMRWAVTGLGAAALALFVIEYLNITNGDVTVGNGVYVGLVAAVVVIVASSYLGTPKEPAPRS